jgi:hypothetical protein
MLCLRQAARTPRSRWSETAPCSASSTSRRKHSWAEVEAWFERYQTRPTWQQSAKLSPDFLAELNDRLDLRERLRHSPNASWRSKLEQSFH